MGFTIIERMFYQSMAIRGAETGPKVSPNS